MRNYVGGSQMAQGIVWMERNHEQYGQVADGPAYYTQATCCRGGRGDRKGSHRRGRSHGRGSRATVTVTVTTAVIRAAPITVIVIWTPWPWP